jgi:hypothetical protein
MAQSLSQMVALYVVSEDRRSVEVLKAGEVEGRFTEGGSVLSFSNGREPIRGIAVTRASLKVAIEFMNRRSDTPGRWSSRRVATSEGRSRDYGVPNIRNRPRGVV